ncbi:MAG: formyl transferase [Candidatus Rokubacteria bacterium]|nr:formyl transferase [Candidatus Rokubacteria bacterium]
MTRSDPLPRVVLLCHEADRIDSEGLAAWLASSLNLVGIVLLREGPGRLLRRARREIRRVGLLRFLDVVAFRAHYRLCLARADAAWIAEEVARLRSRYPGGFDRVPRIVVADPNTTEVERFLRQLEPELMIARCKVILKPGIFSIPTAGTFVFHPGICPEYRNSHGCLWALVNRDLDRVGMTLLRVDAGVDTGPIFLQATAKFDEVRESHVVIQYRVVLENLDAIASTLVAVWNGIAQPLATEGRRSAVWGQPWLSAYLRWKRAARRCSHEAARLADVPRCL